jgi:hypothetical protein
MRAASPTPRSRTRGPLDLDPDDAGLDDAPGRVAIADQAATSALVDLIGMRRKKGHHLGFDRVHQHLALRGDDPSRSAVAGPRGPGTGDRRGPGGASPETTLEQQLMQISQCRYGQPRHAKRDSGAGGRIEHPRGHDDDHAGRRFDVNDLAASAPLRIVAANAPPLECVPAVTNFNFLPDMGRMTARLPSTARTPCSPAPIRAAPTGA